VTGGSQRALPAGDLGELVDWRRRVAELYAEVRRSRDPEEAWRRWVAERERLFTTHPQSPLPPAARTADAVPTYFPYDARHRVLADFTRSEPSAAAVPWSVDDDHPVIHCGHVDFEIDRQPQRLDVFWISGYAGGLLVPFRDATSGVETYGAGRYVIDTAKGADLGTEDGRLILDFNFAYQPSCAYDPRWNCPLTPPSNTLPIAVRAGERYRAP
jgi:uncharacterized protein (DUF1684 family)